MTNTTVKSAQSSIDLCWHLLILCAVAIGASVLPDMAMASASGNNAIQDVFCNLVILLTGTTGKAIATVAVIAVGVGALLGKISWGMALIVGLGIALIFGAASIVTALGGTSTGCGSSRTLIQT